MAEIQDILANLDFNQIAAALGHDPGEVQTAAATATEALLGGLQQNMGDDQGAIGFANALAQHIDNDNAAPQTGAIDLAQLDLNDGAKIVNHILPADQQMQLFGSTGGGLVQKLMPLVAPIVMAYLAKRLAGSGGLGSVLGSLLGAGAGAGAASATSGLGDVLGQILGGGQQAQQAQAQYGGLGDILGQVLGGAQAAPAQAQAQAQQQPSVGGLLQSILFG